VFVLPLLQVVWTNSHTLFLFGPLLTGLLAFVTGVRAVMSDRGTAADADAARERRARAKTALLVFVLTAATCLVNPYGVRGLAFPFLLFEEIRGSAFKDSIGEFRSPFAFARSFPAVVYYEALIGACLVSALVNVRRLDPFWTALLAAQLYLSTLAIRNLPLFALAAVPFVTLNLRSSGLWQERRIRRWMPAVEVAGAVAVVVAGLAYARDLATNRFSVRLGDTNQAGVGVAAHRFPEKVVSFLEERSIEGRIFHNMREGAYLVWRGHEVFIDPRLEVYGEVRYAEHGNAVAAGPGWERTLRDHDCRVALLRHDTPLAERLLASPEWRLVDFDEVATLFVRSDTPGPPALRSPEDFQRVVEKIRERLHSPRSRESVGWLERVVSPKPYKRVGRLLVSADRPALALPFFADASRAFPDDADAYRSCASLHGALGDAASATAMLEEGLLRWPADSWMQSELGAHRFNAGRIEEAGDLAEASLRSDPGNAPAWSLLAQVRGARADFAGAVEAARRAVELEPENDSYRRSLDLYRRSLDGGG
jgi:hypothetical protein